MFRFWWWLLIELVVNLGRPDHGASDRLEHGASDPSDHGASDRSEQAASDRSEDPAGTLEAVRSKPKAAALVRALVI